MSQKKKRSKEELMNKLFNEDNYSNTKYNKTIGKNKSSIDVFRTVDNTKNNNKNEEYNDFEKGDDFFVTNLKK